MPSAAATYNLEDGRDPIYNVVERQDQFIERRNLARVYEKAHEQSVHQMFADVSCLK
jgi:hypothetical protein